MEGEELRNAVLLITVCSVNKTSDKLHATHKAQEERQSHIFCIVNKLDTLSFFEGGGVAVVTHANFS